jgi:hypothetical protein
MPPYPSGIGCWSSSPIDPEVPERIGRRYEFQGLQSSQHSTPEFRILGVAQLTRVVHRLQPRQRLLHPGGRPWCRADRWSTEESGFCLLKLGLREMPRVEELLEPEQTLDGVRPGGCQPGSPFGGLGRHRTPRLLPRANPEHKRDDQQDRGGDDEVESLVPAPRAIGA